MKRGEITSAVRTYVRNMQIDASLARFEGVAYKGALHRMGANVERVCMAAEADARVMRTLTQNTREDHPTEKPVTDAGPVEIQP